MKKKITITYELEVPENTSDTIMEEMADILSVYGLDAAFYNPCESDGVGDDTAELMEEIAEDKTRISRKIDID